MKVLVTGGAGFIGSHTVDCLINSGHSVVVIDNLSSGKLKNLNGRVEFIKMDILDSKLAQVFQSYRFDGVVHLAAQTQVVISQLNPEQDAGINIMGTVRILEACKNSGVKRIVFSSSAAVYGDTEHLPIRETDTENPSSFYGLSKMVAERYIKMFSQQSDLQYSILRYANVYGERQSNVGEGGVISIFINKILKRHPINIYGSGLQTRDFIYVQDIARATCQALYINEQNLICNVSNNFEVSIAELAKKLQHIAGVTAQIEFHPSRPGDIFRSKLCNEHAVNALSWKPSVSLEEGLCRTITEGID